MSAASPRRLARPVSLLLALVLALAAAPASALGADGDLGRPLPDGDGPPARLKLPATAQHAWQGDDVVPGTLLVTLRSDAAAERLARRPGARRLAGRVVAVPAEVGGEFAAARDLADDHDVVAVDPDGVNEWFATKPNDPRYREQWAHRLTNVEAAWDIETGRRNVRVAVLDSGIDATHDDLRDNVHKQINVNLPPNQWPTAPEDNAACDTGVARDHGTMVAGVAGAVGNNEIGIAGVAWEVGIIDVALVHPSAGGCAGPTDSQVIDGLWYVADRHKDAAAVNLSLGRAAAACTRPMQAAIDEVVGNGTAVVAASGNDGNYFRMQPAGCEGVIAVGAVGETGRLAHYSSKNRYLDLVAPGGDGAAGVLTTLANRRYGTTLGTSFAAPYVAGAIALMRAQRQNLTPAQAESALERTAVHPLGAGAHDERYGWGLIDVGAAVRMARSGSIPALRPHPPGRWAAGGARTEPITQAVAVSQRLFADGSAFHAVVARSDDYADALAGSSLAFGVGPLLFTSRSGGLAPATRAELQRALPDGASVYLLGGAEALDPRLDAEVRALGFEAVRLFGTTREFTAVEVAEELERFLASVDIEVWPDALVATRGNWPDAVAAGSFGALFGAPVLLTPTSGLHPATADYLRRRGALFDSVVGIGGDRVVSTEAIRQGAAAANARPGRLGGATRDETAIAVAEAVERTGRAVGFPPPSFAVAVNLDRSDAYAHTLSASAIAGASASPFVPVRQAGETGRVRVPDPSVAWACRKDYDLLLAGGTDLLPAAVGDELQALLEGTDPRC